MTAGTRERIVTSSAALFRRQGYAATGMKQIVEAAGAPFGSIYHFFPGGKEALGAEALRESGALYGSLIDLVFDPAPDVVTATSAFFAAAAADVESSGYADACPIATIALEVASTNEALRAVTAEIFAGWIASLAGHYAEAGIATERARELATIAFCGLEGAFVLARAQRTAQPVRLAGEVATALVAAAMAT